MPSNRHHYIPVFYLKRWSNSEGNVCQFSRPYRNVVAKMLHPSATAYQDNLYAALGVTGPAEQWLEDVFLRQADQEGHDALVELLNGNTNLSPKLRSGWSRFIMTLLSRIPERIALVRAMYATELAKLETILSDAYDEQFADADPPKSSQQKEQDIRRQIEIGTINLLKSVMDLQNVGNHMVQMAWSVFQLNNSNFTLLTSDRPVLMNTGLQHLECQIAMPISPSHLFVAANDPATLVQMGQQTAYDLTRKVNTFVSRNAVKFVYGQSDFFVNFVEKNFRPRKPE